MKKFLYITGAFILVFVITMAWALADMNKITGLYYKEGIDFYNGHAYMFAIKGDQNLKPGYNGKYLSGGFQQVVQAWEHAPRFVKPDFVSEAASKIDEIIDKELTVNEGEEIYNYYIGYDNEYLGRIKLRVGDLYLEEGNKNKALEAYQTVIRSFSYDSWLLEEANKRIEGIKAQK